jgi:hypothetical protein
LNRRQGFARVAGAAALGCAGPAAAHSFGQVYTLPVPFWLYAWAAAAALVLSFLVAGLFLADAGRAATSHERAFAHRLPAKLVAALRAASVLVLALCIVTGFAGTRSVYANFNMTCFWVVFVLGFAWLSALVGDLYALINPWRALAGATASFVPAFGRGRRPYPARAGYWPALVLYFAFIWLELFGRVTPFALSVALSVYTAITLAAVWWVGAEAWFRYGEIFSVFLRLVARLAPVEFAAGADGAPTARFRLRTPLSGLLGRAPEPPTLLLFGLFVLSATAFDGLHEARPWVRLFWSDLYRAVLSHWYGPDLFAAFPQLTALYRGWQAGGLLASPFLYLAAYSGAIWLMDRITARRHGVAALRARFFHSLLPIALAYHVAHYFTLLLGQGPKVLALVSDPLGYGWNLFGTAGWLRGVWLPEPTAVWHAQVAVILAGHVAGVVVAHLEALRIFGNRRTAVLSQLPMLALMVAFTVAGLWILSLPFETAPLRAPT